MARADHVFVFRFGYLHHGIDCGDDTVIHYTGEVGQKSNAAVRRTRIAEFRKGARVCVREYGTCDPPDRVIERAESRLGERGYDLLFNNCEHFATWCKTGKHQSEQVKDRAAVAGGAVGSGTAVAGGIGVVGATGAAAGLSGAGVMSGLATAGSVVGGGAVAGIGVVGATPALVTTAAMRYVLRDDPILHEKEREARTAGRTATAVGAGLGTAGAIATVSAAGTVTGLSGAGIATGLATVGSAVGGGMAAGVALTAAAPAVAAAAIGYGTYLIWRWVRS